MMELFRQMILIMRHDWKKDPFRILRKSYARYRRFGYKNMRRKLKREYYALYPGENGKKLEDKLYKQWRRHYERRLSTQSIPKEGPLFHLFLFLDENMTESWRSSIYSVLEQSYGRWELWIVGVSRLEKHQEQQLKSLIDEDSRIHRINESFTSLSSNRWKIFQKRLYEEYLVPLDVLDRLASYALAFYAQILSKENKLRLLYSDEDQLDLREHRQNPWFKTDWNPDLFLSHNCIGASWCMQRELFESLGGWSCLKDRELAHYDLLLRASRVLDKKEIKHIPWILYHRRERSLSKYPKSRQEFPKLLAELLGEDPGVKVHPGLIPGSCKVEYSLPKEPPKVSVIIPTRDGYELLYRCVESVLEKTDYPNYEVLIVDNQSECPKTLKYLEELKETYSHIYLLHYDHPFNYSAINNYAVKHASGDVLILLNNDVEVISHHWMKELVQHALRPEIGAVGAKLYYDNLTIQHAGVILGFGGVGGHGHKYFSRESEGYFGRLKLIQNYSAVTGACLAVRKKLYWEVGGLEEEYLTVAFNDVDFCLKLLEKGYRNLWTPYAELYHHESKTRGIDDTPEKKARFDAEVAYMIERWKPILQNDPYYSPHLSLFFEDFRIESYWKQRKELWK